MATFRCKTCGGELKVQEGMSICTCDYCGTKQTISVTAKDAPKEDAKSGVQEKVIVQQNAGSTTANAQAAKKRKIIIGLVAAAALILVTVKVIIPNINYNAAVASMEDGKIIEAYEGFAALNGYKDSNTKKTELFDQYKTEKLKASVAGDVVTFGVYEQDNK